jgi:hypothetical protein
MRVLHFVGARPNFLRVAPVHSALAPTFHGGYNLSMGGKLETRVGHYCGRGTFHQSAGISLQASIG